MSLLFISPYRLISTQNRDAQMEREAMNKAQNRIEFSHPSHIYNYRMLNLSFITNKIIVVMIATIKKCKK